jgi:4'-phosphopantetheinyl transferase
MYLVPLHSGKLPASIEIHRLDLNTSAPVLFHDLSADERTRALRFARRADQARFTQTRTAVRRLLGGRLGCLPCEVPLSVDRFGKPFVDDKCLRSVTFNVSHAGDHALIALACSRARLQLGVDIEWCDQDVDLEAMLVAGFTVAEGVEIRSEQDPRTSFCQKWVAKEAVLKAVGVGIAEHLHSVSIHRDESRRLRVACLIPEWRSVEVLEVQAPPGYAAAVAWRSQDSN